MYVPKLFEERDIGVLHALIRAHPLGTWVVNGQGGLEANHIPFLVDPERGPHGALLAHVARGNPIWKALGEGTPSLIVFQGPQGYITPSWYPSKGANGKVVPTWNYAVVHAHGTARAIDDPKWLLEHVTQTVNFHESKRAVPWKVSDAPADYIDTMVRAIVGVEITLTRLEGKWKMSQNRTEPDKLGTIAGLTEKGDENSLAIASLVRRHVKEKEG